MIESEGFVILVNKPGRSLLHELHTLVDELDACRQSVVRLRKHYRAITKEAARQKVLDCIQAYSEQYARIMRCDIPDLVRSIRHTGDSVPHDLVQRLRSHYGR
jgi:hypothetical protein